MQRRKKKRECICSSQGSSLCDYEMPDVALANFEKLTDDIEFFTRCTICGQYWHFFFCGRHDTPTFEKLEPHIARIRIEAWNAAKPEREAKAAKRVIDDCKRDADFSHENTQHIQLEIFAKSLGTIFIRFASVTCLLAGGALSLVMMTSRTQPAWQTIAIAAACYITGFVMAMLYVWRIRLIQRRSEPN